MSRRVDYYFSFQSPWAYIGHNVFREVAKTYDLKVNYKPVVLVELFSETGGLPLPKRHPVRQRYRMVELQRWRDKRGLKFHLQPANWPLNARLADGIVIAAIEAGLDPEPFMRRGFAGVWEDQLNLADPATLTNPDFPASNCSTARVPMRLVRPTSKTVRTRLPPMCLARLLLCSMARFSGDRIESNCWRTH